MQTKVPKLPRGNFFFATSHMLVSHKFMSFFDTKNVKARLAMDGITSIKNFKKSNTPWVPQNKAAPTRPMIPARPKAATPVCDAALLDVEAGEEDPNLVVLEPDELVLVVVPEVGGDLVKSQYVKQAHIHKPLGAYVFPAVVGADVPALSLIVTLELTQLEKT